MTGRVGKLYKIFYLLTIEGFRPTSKVKSSKNIRGKLYMSMLILYLSIKLHTSSISSTRPNSSQVNVSKTYLNPTPNTSS